MKGHGVGGPAGGSPVVKECLVIARRLVVETPDPVARARAADLAEQFAARLRGTEAAERDLF